MAPEIVMQTPAAKALEAAVQKQLGEYGYSNPDDPVMAEYVVVMLANSKGADDITQELRELVGEDLYDVSFTTWLFDEVGRQFGGGASTSAIKPEEDGPGMGEAGTSSIPTQPDSRDRRSSARGGGGGGFGGNVFNQAMTGLKRPAPEAALRDPPPHRRRVDEVDSAFAGPRRNDRRDDRGDWGGPSPARDRGPGPGRGGRGGGGRSLLERTGMSGGGVVNPAFLPNGGGGGAAMEHAVQMQMQNLAQQQHQMMMAQQNPGFFQPGGAPQLFLANGQPYIPPPNFAMQQPQPLHSPASPARPPPTPQRDLSTLPKKPDGKECKYNSACKNAWCPNAHVSPAGTKDSMLLSFEPCEKQIECLDKDCTKAHVSPQQKDPNASVWAKAASAPAPKPVAPSPVARTRPASLNPTPCRFGAGCTRPDCVFTHPWDAKPGTVPVPCKFGTGCTRADCHFQHPPGRKLASKNITKSFVEQIGPMPASEESKMNRLKRFGDAAAAGGEVERIIPGQAADQKENGKVNGGEAGGEAEEGKKESADASDDPGSPAGQVLAQ